MEVVLVPQPQTSVICLCFTGGKVRVIGAAAYACFPALLNKGADYTNNQLRLCLWQGQESDSIDICAVHAPRALLPSKP